MNIIKQIRDKIREDAYTTIEQIISLKTLILVDIYICRSILSSHGTLQIMLPIDDYLVYEGFHHER